MTLHDAVLEAMGLAVSKLEQHNIQAKVIIEIDNHIEWQYFKHDISNRWMHMANPSREMGYVNYEPVFVYHGKHVVKGPR